jgi:hypothetical protein
MLIHRSTDWRLASTFTDGTARLFWLGFLSAWLALRLFFPNALSFPVAGPYDLVVTHFFPDCLSQAELDRLVARVTPPLAPGAF